MKKSYLPLAAFRDPIRFFLFSLFFLFLSVLSSYAQIPPMMNEQAKLLNKQNQPINATLTMTFSIYNTATGGSPAGGYLWQEVKSVTVSNGVYSTKLGSVVPLSTAVFSGSSVYLGTMISPDTSEMTPRAQLVSVPYSFNSEGLTSSGAIQVLAGGGGVNVSTFSTDGNLILAYGISATTGTFSGNVTANEFIGSGAGLTNLPAAAVPDQIDISTITADVTTPYGGVNITTNAFIQGNVGIGLTNPAAPLHLATAGGTSIFLGDSNNTDAIKSVQVGVGSELGFFTNGTAAANERVRINQSGNVGISSSTPQNLLVVGSGNGVLNVQSGGNVGIGTTAPATRLHVSGGDAQVGDVTASTISASGYLTMANLGSAPGAATPGRVYYDSSINTLRFSTGTNAGAWVNISTTPSGGVPYGAVSYFDLAACPTGWSELTTARGRYFVGLPLSGTLAGTDGQALTDLEDRPTGQHTHTATQAAHSHLLYDNYFASGDPLNLASVGGSLGTYTGGARSSTAGSPFYTDTKAPAVTVANSAGTSGVAGTNAPYMQLLACQCTTPGYCINVGTGGAASTAANLTGGSANQVPYQTGPGATTFTGTPGANAVLFANSGAPTWTNAPTLTGTNFSGTASALTAGNVTTNANLTGPITSVGNATSVASQTGTGSTFVMNNSPTLISPALGTPASGVATNLTGTATGLTAGNATTAAAANALNSATTVVNVSGAAAPTSGQVLTATSGSAATWQTASGGTLSYLTPINNSGATSDLALGYDQIAYSTFSAATSMPLHIACGAGQIYEMYITGTYSAPSSGGAASQLQPNNTVYANGYTYRQLYGTGSTPGTGAVGNVDNGFRLEVAGISIYSAKSTIFTDTAAKRVISTSANTSTTASYISYVEVEWNDTTTVWSSLGTVVMPNAWTGTITVKRVQ